VNKEQHNDLLYQIIAIDRLNKTGKQHIAERKTLRILARLVTEIYEMQHEQIIEEVGKIIIIHMQIASFKIDKKAK
jgi:hypothetical protein